MQTENIFIECGIGYEHRFMDTCMDMKHDIKLA